MSVWVVVVLNPSGQVAYAYGFSTAQNGNAGLTQAQTNLTPGWSAVLLQVPALDSTLPSETF